MFSGVELSHKYKTLNGIRIFDDFTAQLGWTAAEGNILQVSIEGWPYKDFRISEDDVFVGTELQYNEGLWGYTNGCVTSNAATGDAAGIEYEIPSNMANENIRAAMFLSDDGSGDATRTQFYVRTYNTNTHQWGWALPFQYTTLDNSIKMFSISLPYSTAPGYVSELNSSMEYIISRSNTIRGNVPPEYVGVYYNMTHFTCNLPIFDSQEHCDAYLTDLTNQTIDGIMNLFVPDPEEDYKKQFDFWYIKNKWGHNTRNVSSASNTADNYRFKPIKQGICFVKHTPTASEPYDRILTHFESYEAYAAAWGENDDESFNSVGIVDTHFLTKSISFGSDDYYTKFDYDTNIPLWDTQQDADDYYNGLKDITEAVNYDYISRKNDTILDPDLPGTDKDEQTTLGTNGMRYSYGNRIYQITNTELASLMEELFDPANLQDILDGTKLFGSNNMEAISGVMYIPLTDLSEICGLGSLTNIKIGSWESQTAQGKRIIDNEGTIDCGSFYFNRVYNDFRDYEPYQLLFCNLPFCGCHQLTISKYLDKTVNVSYNIDVTTGAIVCKLTADGILLDIFEGTCGASRPISATNNNAYINSIVNAITGASSSASGSIEGITNATSQIGGAMGAGSTAAAGALAAGGTLAVGAAAGGAAASGIYTAYQVKNAVDNPPQMHRGSLAGNLAYNLNVKPTFLFFTKRTIRPEGELEVVGYPSSHGGKIGQFSGFLSCSAVKLADFDGTEAERAEIMEILKGGIYL